MSVAGTVESAGKRISPSDFYVLLKRHVSQVKKVQQDTAQLQALSLQQCRMELTIFVSTRKIQSSRK